MLTNLQDWMALFQARLTETFPDRVAFLGLQGSRSRGEEREDSDIDVVVVLDRLAPEDVRRYRAMLDALPERELVCGFLGGWEELSRWEPSDLFQLCHDTTPIIGSLEPLVAGLEPEDVARAVRIGACNVYHGCVHTLCHGRSGEHLRGLYKSAVFVLQALRFQQTGVYLRHAADLLPVMKGLNAQVLETAMRLRAGEPVDFEPMAERLFRWAQRMIALPWNRMETAHFTLYYADADEPLAQRLAGHVDRVFDSVSRTFSLAPAEEKFDFYLCPDVNAFMERTGKTRDTYETWMVGWAGYELRRLCVLSHRVVKDRPPEAMDQVVTHEIVHIAMDALRPGDACPLWLGEGVAALVAGQTRPTKSGPAPHIADWRDELSFAEGGGYDYAGVYVWFFIEKYGLDSFKRVYAGEEPDGAGLYFGFEEEAVAEWLKRARDGFTPWCPTA